MSLYDYYIIDVVATRTEGRVVFWGKGDCLFTTKPQRALVITEESVNANLNRYDDGKHTRAVLCSAVHNHTGDLMELLQYRKPQATEVEMIA